MAGEPRRARAMLRSIEPARARRFGRSVSGSCRARCSMRSSLFYRAVTSCLIATKWLTSPVAPRTGVTVCSST